MLVFSNKDLYDILNKNNYEDAILLSAYKFIYNSSANPNNAEFTIVDVNIQGDMMPAFEKIKYSENDESGAFNIYVNGEGNRDYITLEKIYDNSEFIYSLYYQNYTEVKVEFYIKSRQLQLDGISTPIKQINNYTDLVNFEELSDYYILYNNNVSVTDYRNDNYSFTKGDYIIETEADNDLKLIVKNFSKYSYANEKFYTFAHTYNPDPSIGLNGRYANFDFNNGSGSLYLVKGLTNINNQRFCELISNKETAELLNIYNFNYKVISQAKIYKNNSLDEFYDKIDPTDSIKITNPNTNNENYAIEYLENTNIEYLDNPNYRIHVEEMNKRDRFIYLYINTDDHSIQKVTKQENKIIIENIIITIIYKDYERVAESLIKITNTDEFWNAWKNKNDIYNIYEIENVNLNNVNLEKNDNIILNSVTTSNFMSPGGNEAITIIKEYIISNNNIYNFNKLGFRIEQKTITNSPNETITYTSNLINTGNTGGYILLLKPLLCKFEKGINLSSALNTISKYVYINKDVNTNFLKADKDKNFLLNEKELKKFQNMFRKKCYVKYICGQPVIVNGNC